MRKNPEDTKIYQKEYQKKWYQDHKETCKNSLRKRRNDNRKYIEEIRKNSKCEECLENHPACLDFHHINESQKDLDISRAICDWGLERIKHEIMKCQVLCSNCHRKLHWEQTHKVVNKDF
jgi:hypothetical protein